MSSVSTLILPKAPSQEFIEKIAATIGEMHDLEVFHNQIVVAKFIRTHVGTSGRILAASQTQMEDKWQSKVGLVVKIGPRAFIDEPGYQFHGLKVNVGEWVLYRNSDGWDFDYCAEAGADKIPMRMLEDTHLRGRVARPELVW